MGSNSPLQTQNVPTSHTDQVGQHMFEVGGLAGARPTNEGNRLVLLGGHHVLVSCVANRVNMGRQVIHLAFLEEDKIMMISTMMQ